MRFILVAVAVLGLLSVGQSAPVIGCEHLIQPLEFNSTDHLLGRWTYIGEATNLLGSKLLTEKFLESAWLKITAANETDAVNILQSQKMFGTCFSIISKMTMRNSTLFMGRPANASRVLLNTSCPDCYVAYSQFNLGRQTHRGVQLLSRREKVTAAELQEFTKQVECLKLPSPAILDPEKGFCPDDSTSQETTVNDLIKFMEDKGSEMANLFDSNMSSENDLQKLIKMFSSISAELKKHLHSQ